jgi:ectoine hydroxylase-related dioxygenase (phytanoyl-CoA dioxygenase family)
VKEAAELQAHLMEHGYAVVKDVADKKEILKAKQLLWDFLEEYAGGCVRREDSRTWWDDR